MGPGLRSTITLPGLPEHVISGGPLMAVKQFGEFPIMLNIEGRVKVTKLGFTVGEEKYEYGLSNGPSSWLLEICATLWRKPHIYQQVLHVLCIIGSLFFMTKHVVFCRSVLYGLCVHGTLITCYILFSYTGR